QGVLALEEPVAAHPAGGPALGRVLPVRGHLHGRRPGSRQRAGAACHGDHDRLAVPGAGAGPDRAEPGHRAARRQPPPPTPALPPAARPWGRTAAAENLSNWASVVMNTRS